MALVHIYRGLQIVRTCRVMSITTSIELPPEPGAIRVRDFGNHGMYKVEMVHGGSIGCPVVVAV